MTFRETDYPEIWEVVVSQAKSFKNPLLAVEMLKEVLKLHKDVPLYPGIVGMCVPKLVVDVPKEEMKKGDWVSVARGKGHMYGQVDRVEADRIVLKNTITVECSDTTEISREETGSCKRVQKDVLKKTWPSLVFEKR